MNEHNEILFSSDNIKDIDDRFFSKAIAAIDKNKSGVVQITIDGKDFYVAFAAMDEIGWCFCTIVSEDELLNSAEGTHEYFLKQIRTMQDKMNQEYSYMNTLSVVIPICLLMILFFMSIKLSRRFVKPINELSDGVREISSGNLDKKISVSTNDEIEHLAICFNAMTDEIKTYMKNLEN